MWDLNGPIGPAHRWITNSSFVQWMAFGTLGLQFGRGWLGEGFY